MNERLGLFMKGFALAVVLGLPLAACGPSAARQEATPPASGSERAAAPAVAPVGAGELAALLPSLPGWQRERPSAERVTSPISFSDASVRLTNGMAVITVKITDTALNDAFITPFAGFLAGRINRKTATGYEKSIREGDVPGGEKWDDHTKTGNLTVVVNGRFLIEVDGSGISDPEILHAALGKTNLARLEAMK